MSGDSPETPDSEINKLKEILDELQGINKLLSASEPEPVPTPDSKSQPKLGSKPESKLEPGSKRQPTKPDRRLVILSLVVGILLLILGVAIGTFVVPNFIHTNVTPTQETHQPTLPPTDTPIPPATATADPRLSAPRITNISVARKDRPEDLIPVPGGYIVRFTADDLANAPDNVEATFEIRISFEALKDPGCFSLKDEGQQQQEQPTAPTPTPPLVASPLTPKCSDDNNITNPVLFELTIPFASKDDGTTICDATGGALQTEYYKDPKRHSLTLTWKSKTSNEEIPLSQFSLISNFVVLKEDGPSNGTILPVPTQISAFNLTSCEASIVNKNLQKKIALYMYRAKDIKSLQDFSDLDVKAFKEKFAIPEELQFWLGLQQP